MKEKVFIPNTGWHDWDITSQRLKDGEGPYYEVACSSCGIKGIQRDIFGVEVLKSNKKLRREYCNSSPSKVSQILFRNEDLRSSGFMPGQIVERIPCPKIHEEEFKEDVWVFSYKRNEPVRLLPHEYKII